MQHLCNFCPYSLTFFSILFLWSLLALVAIPLINKIKMKKSVIILLTKKINRKALAKFRVSVRVCLHSTSNEKTDYK